MCELAPGRGEICGIITTFHPDSGLSDRVFQLAKQVNQIVIVDNHSTQDVRKLLQGLSNQRRIKFIMNDGNVGVAKALNQGIATAKNDGYHWVLLMDQDTQAADDLVDSLCNIYRHYPDKSKLAIIGANYIDSITSENKKIHYNGCIPFFRYEHRNIAITSGSLLSLKAYQVIGSFRDDFFIDMVDVEYCLRAKLLGYRILVSHKPLMTHQIGCGKPHRLLFRTTVTSNHPPVRHYYMTRNYVVLLKNHFSTEPLWILRLLYSRLATSLLVILYEERKTEKLKAMYLGILDGIKGPMGAVQRQL